MRRRKRTTLPRYSLVGERRSKSCSSAQESLPLRRLERRVVEIETVEDLVVVVARRGIRMIGELASVGAFKDKDGRSPGGELGVQPRIVEGVVLVRQDFHGLAPRPGRNIGLGVPEFAKNRWLAEGLHEHRDPTLAKRIPRDRAAVRFDGPAVGGGGQAFLRLEHFPGGGILPRFERRPATQFGQWIAEKNQVLALRALPE